MVYCIREIAIMFGIENTHAWFVRNTESIILLAVMSFLLVMNKIFIFLYYELIIKAIRIKHVLFVLVSYEFHVDKNIY